MTAKTKKLTEGLSVSQALEALRVFELTYHNWASQQERQELSDTETERLLETPQIA